MKQKIYLDTNEGMNALKMNWAKRKIKKIFFVHGRTYYGSKWEDWLNAMNIEVVHFTEFSSNPSYDSIEKGVYLMETENCDAVLAIGGGSAIDVAKCVKLFAGMPKEESYLFQQVVENQLPFYAIPTTAGTGSESTCFAVIYYKGEKKSIEHSSCLPLFTVLDVAWLDKLPILQKKATLLDALAHSIESFWSVNATEDSQQLARRAIQSIMENYQSYLFGNSENAGRAIFEAANLAGQAINMTRTTAGHAMCYKLTTLFQLPHGIAVAECLPALWQFMIEHIDQCADKRGAIYVESTFAELACLLHGGMEELSTDQEDKSVKEYWTRGAAALQKLIDEIGISKLPSFTKEQLKVLVHSVNIERLKNNPIILKEEDITWIYQHAGK